MNVDFPDRLNGQNNRPPSLGSSIELLIHPTYCTTYQAGHYLTVNGPFAKGHMTYPPLNLIPGTS